MADRAAGGRHVRYWPAPTAGALGVLVAIWLMLSLQWVVGVEPVGRLARTGTAEIVACARSAPETWMVYRCKASIHWDTSGLRDKAVTEELVFSVSALSGTVAVGEYGFSYRYVERHVVAPVDHPVWTHGKGFYTFLTAVAAVVAFALFGFAGYWLGRLVPATRVKETTKNWRGVDRSRKRKRG